MLSVSKDKEDTKAREMHSLVYYHCSRKGSARCSLNGVFLFKHLIKGFIKSWISARRTMSQCYKIGEGFLNFCFPEENACCSL